MVVIAISKVNWGIETIREVSNIAFNGTTYTITYGSASTKTFAASSYYIRIME